jgi:4-alpha-glucanotransferase
LKRTVPGLAELGRLFRLEPAYTDMQGERQTADAEARLLVLQALGAELTDAGSALHAVRARRDQLARLPIQPVHVAWDGVPRLRLRLPHDRVERVVLELRLESGDVELTQADAKPVQTRPQHGWQATHAITLPRRLPHGYHVISVEARSGTLESFIIAAPRQAHVTSDREWGVFIPLYSLCSSRNWGIGDYTDLEQLARWTGSLGGGFVGTLPLLATFLDVPFEPSPYSPASRLFWNELFLDLTAVPGWNGAAFAGLAGELAACRAGGLVDYRRIAALKRRELERTLRASAADAYVADGMRVYADTHAHAVDYARFRAVCDRRREGWNAWPEPLRAGCITADDYAPEDYRYHVFVQWQAEHQLGRTAAARAEGAAALYLDMPLGVNPQSYDAWRFRELFAPGVAAGAPPDPLFTGGQNWGFRPLNPAPLRAGRYGYLIEALRHHFRHASILRLDHVMSLYRLFWVPDGMPATRGVYVRYAADELFAILVLESARHQAVVVGEDLGTVPAAVRRTMEQHGVQRMHVVQFEVSPDRDPPVTRPPCCVVASLNTHDMPTFTGFWRGSEIDDQLELGLIDRPEYDRAQRRRAVLRARLGKLLGAGDDDAGIATVRDRLLHRLADSAARYVLVNLEDLWLEDRPQNVPGTSTERPNWQRRSRWTLDDILDSDAVTRSLRDINRLRRSAAHQNGSDND